MKLSDWLQAQRGRGSELAQAVGVAQPLISRIAAGEKAAPIGRCLSIERATGGAVTRQDLRPDDWRDIWPELATPQPTEPAAAGV